MVIRTQKDRKLQTLIEVCTDFASLSPSANIHRPAEQVFAVEDDESGKTCSPWQIDLSGLARVDPILQCRLRCSKCLLWLGGWGTRCDRLLVGWIIHVNHLDLRERLSPLVRDTVHRSGRVLIFLGSSTSAAVSWNILKLVAQSQSRRVSNNGTTTHRPPQRNSI